MMLMKTVGPVVLVAVLVPRASAQGRGTPRQDAAAEAWQLLQKKYDKNKDGTISAREYPRGEGKFNAYDRNGDGELSVEDFTGRNPAGRGNRAARRRPGVWVDAWTLPVARRWVRGS